MTATLLHAKPDSLPPGQKAQDIRSTKPGPSKQGPGSDSDAEQKQYSKYLLLLIQLVGSAGLIHYFRLETKAFFELTLLVIGGFAVHYHLPVRYRMPFFLCLSLASIGWVLGPINGAWLVAIGLGLIGICHLPLSIAPRIALLLITGAALAVARADWAPVPWAAAVWPILASMFMFRLIVYLYDRRFDPTPATFSSTLSYFFMLPNVCFPLFPVVDYRTFRRSYYDADRHQIYQTGVQWIVRGLIQLILYRFVYYYLSMGPSEVVDTGDVVRYVVSGFLLYLRISGHFHIIVGILKLFGFNLPETHHWYFLASSFTDFWRRINIYWKDFMLKIFYYPAFFRLRRWGTTRGMIVSTILVFVATWLLHSYQWFWLRGSYQFTWNDVLFWAILCGLVTINAHREATYGRRRALGQRTNWWRAQAVLVAKTLATFATICVLWSLWTSESLEAWWSLWKAAGTLSVSDSRLIPAFAAGLCLFVAAILVAARIDAARAAGWRPSFKLQACQTAICLIMVPLLGTPEFYAQLLPDRYAGQFVEIVSSTREIRLSGHDADMVERGYYEQLLNVQNFNSQLWEVYASWPLNWSRLEDTGALRRTGDFLFQELAPQKDIHFRNAVLTTNEWGMRDRSYEKLRPPGVHRLALVGSSHVMGYGVNDDQTFDSRLEGYWNKHASERSTQPIEVLNFAVDGYSPLQELYLTELRVFEFEPNVLAHIAQNGAPYRCAIYLSQAARLGVTIPYPELVEIIERANIGTHTSKPDAERQIRPFGDEILEWAYRRFVSLCRERGVLPLWIYLPTAGEQPGLGREHMMKIAADAGFVTLDLSDCYRRHDPKAIWFGEWDHHPNAFGHQLVADEMYRVLISSPEVLQVLGTKL